MYSHSKSKKVEVFFYHFLSIPFFRRSGIDRFVAYIFYKCANEKGLVVFDNISGKLVPTIAIFGHRRYCVFLFT